MNPREWTVSRRKIFFSVRGELDEWAEKLPRTVVPFSVWKHNFSLFFLFVFILPNFTMCPSFLKYNQVLAHLVKFYLSFEQ